MLKLRLQMKSIYLKMSIYRRLAKLFRASRHEPVRNIAIYFWNKHMDAMEEAFDLIDDLRSPMKRSVRSSRGNNE